MMMLRDLNTYTPDEFAEMLVDLDTIMSLLTEPMACQDQAICPSFSDHNTPLGTTVIYEGELATPGYVYVTQKGALAFRFNVVEENLGYASFDAVNLETQFPEVGRLIEAALLRDHGASLVTLWRATNRRFDGKPQLVDMINNAINHGRKMRACNLLEEEGEARDGFYQRQDDFGIF